MIENFRHRGLKRLYEKGDKSRLRPDIADKAELYLSVLDSAEKLEELDITGFNFHRLTGDMRGFYSVFVSRNHRIVFRFEDGRAFDIDLVDYH
ncbi:MAG: plasmid maintenance system killer protein [Nitrospina sp.]|jgi:proteic killer suppression protein|nr:plasmid maintenance system killer protein [Nitrospina sp.]MBT3414368.1 plasmid maintenance system killer protein [Nitrospina sp.]MBT3857604.1 plasmid maintenance system killer protein [Nitrospina sp.]MBT4103464.1 plasmid maintenance system killer protein [Nitrospina sp.]MBT4389129.1 plasmid maintenance system killer protein [Nitrospina sp.]